MPPMYMKFHPRPSSTSAHQKFAKSCPDRPIATHASCAVTPASITCRAPKRLTSEPVKKEGPNIATACAEMTLAADEYGRPQKPIASGVAVMRRFITA